MTNMTNKARSQRKIKWMYDYLAEEGEASAQEMADHLRLKRTKDGHITSMAFDVRTMSGLLTRSPLFRRSGSTKLKAISGGSYEVALWSVVALDDLARKYEGVKHPLTRLKNLPKFVRDYITEKVGVVDE